MWRRWTGQRGSSGFLFWITGGRLVGSLLSNIKTGERASRTFGLGKHVFIVTVDCFETELWKILAK